MAAVPVFADTRLAQRRDRIRGCLLGGAVGDALGYAVEFDSLADIRRAHGDAGITELVFDPATAGAPVSDDTQMTLFTAEGVLRGLTRAWHKGIGGPDSGLAGAYLRWLVTQDGVPAAPADDDASPQAHHARRIRESLGWAVTHGCFAPGPSPIEQREHSGEAPGWLVRVRGLHARRAPGNTCLTALRDPAYAQREVAANDSKGCGGVMRAAPCGLLAAAGYDDAWARGVRAAGLTHGHPAGWASGGALAVMVRVALEGEDFEMALTIARDYLMKAADDAPRVGEVLRALDAAERLVAGGTVPTPEAIETLGGGWVAEEALAIGVACALVGERTGDAELALRLAVNHSGDSDSTGSIAGNLLGVRLGEGAIPERWREGIELRGVIERVADDLAIEVRGDEGWWVRYPGY